MTFEYPEEVVYAREAARRQLVAENERLQTLLERVRAIHSSRPVSQLGTAWMVGAKDECSQCRREWPCSTILALDAPVAVGNQQTTYTEGGER